MPDLPTLAHRYGLPLSPSGQAIECPPGRIVAFLDALGGVEESAYPDAVAAIRELGGRGY